MQNCDKKHNDDNYLNFGVQGTQIVDFKVSLVKRKLVLIDIHTDGGEKAIDVKKESWQNC